MFTRVLGYAKHPKSGKAELGGGAGGRPPSQDVGRFSNLISTGGIRLCPPDYYSPSQIFKPSDIPAQDTHCYAKKQDFKIEHTQGDRGGIKRKLAMWIVPLFTTL